MKQVSVYVPEHAVIEAITPAYRTFTTANEFLKQSGKKPFFKVEYVGLKKTIYANDGEYSIKIDRLLKDIPKTDLIILPALYGDIDNAIATNSKAITWIKQMY